MVKTIKIGFYQKTYPATRFEKSYVGRLFWIMGENLMWRWRVVEEGEYVAAIFFNGVWYRRLVAVASPWLDANTKREAEVDINNMKSVTFHTRPLFTAGRFQAPEEDWRPLATLEALWSLKFGLHF